MYCVRCGNKGSKHLKYCAECGMRLISPELLEKLLEAVEGTGEKSSVPPRIANAGKANPEAKRRAAISIFDSVEPPPIRMPEKPAGAGRALQKKPKKPSNMHENREASKAGREKPIPDRREGPVKPRKPEKNNSVIKLPEKKRTKTAAAAKKDAFIREMRLPVPEKREKAHSAADKPLKNRNGAQRKPGIPKADREQMSIRKKKTVIPKRVAGKRKPSRPIEQATFFENHARSVISMMLLVVTVFLVILWGTMAPSGKVTFAQMGVGGASGYILLGDESMDGGNYARAVEHYYKALQKKTSYEAAIKLARAYRMTGDIDMETSALLLCMDQYPNEKEAAERLAELYPEPVFRPETVRKALEKYGENQ